jgi:hypothetical protein
MQNIYLPHTFLHALTMSEQMSAGTAIRAPIPPPRTPKTIIVMIVKMRKSRAGGDRDTPSFWVNSGADTGCPTETYMIWF